MQRIDKDRIENLLRHVDHNEDQAREYANPIAQIIVDITTGQELPSLIDR